MASTELRQAHFDWDPNGDTLDSCGEVAVSRDRSGYLPLEADRAQLLRSRNLAAFEENPRLAELETRLLDLGGTTALLFLREPRAGELLDRGRSFSGDGARRARGKKSDCHANAARLFCRSEGKVRIASGYALSPDGLWRQHSWGWDPEKSLVIETTEDRDLYYGYVLDDPESLEFILGNCPLSTPLSQKDKKLLDFLADYFGRQFVHDAMHCARVPREPDRHVGEGEGEHPVH
jgi:hypothetical protein